ncbi:Regulator of calcineurin 2 [Nakaseomyces bracarensis]|uniref:Regulator of calcineurin 2 n=1 Tax=Nakaseomyces bracarensis TaxID=273131 RepID=A0ABR4NSZ8_9SACH
MKTQVLITDVPKEKFDKKWPKELEHKLFEKYPELRPRLQYFTPLPFMDRVIIIMDDEESATKVYEYLKTVEPTTSQADSEIKLYMTESLLSNRFRSRSTGEVAEESDSLGTQAHSQVDNGTDKPVLSLDTNPVRTGIDAGSLAMGSPSLSPDRRSSVESPTLLKFADGDRAHLYQEPLPNKEGNSSSTSLASENDETVLKQPQNLSNLSILTEGSSGVGAGSPPRSPSITVREFTT